ARDRPDRRQGRGELRRPHGRPEHRDAPVSLRESPGGSAFASSTDADVVGAWLQISREGRRVVPGGEEPTADRRRAAGGAFHDAPAPIAHMRLRTATAVPALPEAPGLPSMPVIR